MPTVKETIKSLSNYTNDTAIDFYISSAQKEILAITKLTTYDAAEFDDLVVEMALTKLNRKGNEGIAATNLNGTTETYLEQYSFAIQQRLKKYLKKVVLK